MQIDGVDVPARIAAHAARTVRLAIRVAFYRPDAAGLPSDPVLAAAVAEATVEQARALLARDAADKAVAQAAAESPLGGPLASASIEGASWTAATDRYAAIPHDLHVSAESGLSTYAEAILADAGLLSGPVIVHG